MESPEYHFTEAHGLKILKSQAEGKLWDVVIIESGLSKNGNFYPADVLRNSAHLFEGVKAAAYRFGGKLDHVPNDAGDATRFSENLVGWFENVVFGAFTRKNGSKGEGLLGKFHVMPAASWLSENLKYAFEHGRPDILGFSIDARGDARPTVINGRKVNLVEKIIGVDETTVVTEPAAGGGVLRLVASVQGNQEPTETGGSTMSETTTPVVDQAAKEALDKREKELKEQTEDLAAKTKELAVREGAALVAQRVVDSGLPEKFQEKVKAIFEGRADITAELVDAELTSMRELSESLSESTGNPEGLGGAHGEVDGGAHIEIGDGEKEKHEKAWDGFFNNGRPVDGVTPFRGLKEAWGAITGKWASNEQVTDWIFDSIRLAMPHRVRDNLENHHRMLKESWDRVAPHSLRESITTGDFSISFGVAMFKRLQKEYTQDPNQDWRDIVSSIENLSDATSSVEVPRIGGQTILPIVSENAPYLEGTDPTEVNETLTPTKRGRLLKLTWEDVLADRIGVLRRMPRILARSSNRTIQQLVFDEIESNPNMADGNPLIDATHNNLVATSPALDYDEFVNAVQLLRDQTEQDSGEKLGLRPWRLLTGPKREAKAIEVTESRVKDQGSEDATISNANNRWGVSAMMSIALGLTAATDDQWYVVTSPDDAETIAVGFLGGRDQPDIFVQGVDTPTNGSFFDADAITFKVRLVVGAKVLDHRWIAGSLV